MGIFKFRSRDGDRTARGLLGDLLDAEAWSVRLRSGRRCKPRGLASFRAGSSFTVQTRTEDGIHEIVDITRRLRGGASVPAALPASEQAAVRSVVRSMLDLTAFESGTTLTEVTLADDGPRIVGCRIQEP
ncbi:hypothetical protein [Actinospica robiniae]|uniref:hypothetical protein n=1 Tax=Actinospica robiniae TaxID=304901 RepID=UPI00041C2844|nr:hypothetical protein [Actinospica robiniae]